MSDTVFDLKAKVSADVSPFNRAMDSSATSVSSSLSTIHSAAKMFIGTGVVRTFMKATEAAYKFGQSMADISAISDLNIKHLSKSILQMENVYGRAAHVGDTVYEIISSGVRGSEQELLNFAKVAGQAAVSIKADLYDTANVITTLTNAYGMSANEVGRIADMLFVTVREGKAHGNELAKTLGLVTNTAAEAGVTLEEMTAVISILSRTQSPSQSMIGFNQMLNGLIKPTQEAQREAEKWGIEIGATALQTKGLTAILTEMHEKIGGNVEAINKILGNIRAMRAGVSLTGRQFENFIDVLNQAKAEIGTGVSMEAFQKQTDTARQSLENLKTQMDKTFIGIGQDFEPITKRLSEFTETLLKTLSSIGGVGRSSIYIVAIVGAIKSTTALLSKISSISTTLKNSAEKTAHHAKSYADHMERASRATLSTISANSAVAKDLNKRKTSSVVPLLNAADNRVLMASRRVDELMIPYTAKRSVANEAQKNYDKSKVRVQQKLAALHQFDELTMLANPSGEMSTHRRRQRAGHLGAIAKAERDLQRSNIELSDANKELVVAGEQLAKAQIYLAESLDNERKLRKDIKASAPSAAMQFETDKQRRLWMLKEGYSQRAGVLATAKLQKPSAFTQQDETALRKAEAKAQKYEIAYIKHLEDRNNAVDSYTKKVFAQADILKRFNRRFHTSYKDFDAAMRAVNFRRTFTAFNKGILSVGKGFSKGLSLLGTFAWKAALVKATAETSFAVGESIAKAFNLEDKFLSEKDRRLEHENNMHNIEAQRRVATGLLDRLSVIKKLTEAEKAEYTAAIALADSSTKLTQVRNRISKEMENKPAEPTFESRIFELQNKLKARLGEIETIDPTPTSDIIKKGTQYFKNTGGGSFRLGMTPKELEGYAAVFEINRREEVRKQRENAPGARDALDIATDLASVRMFDTIINDFVRGGDDEIQIRAELKSLKIGLQEEMAQRFMQAFLSEDWKTALPNIATQFEKDMQTAFAYSIVGDRGKLGLPDTLFTGDRRSGAEALASKLHHVADTLIGYRSSMSTEDVKQAREYLRTKALKEFSTAIFGAVSMADRTKDAVYNPTASDAYRQKGLLQATGKYDAISHAVSDLVGSQDVYAKQQKALVSVKNAIDTAIMLGKHEGLTEDDMRKDIDTAKTILTLKSNMVDSAKATVASYEKAFTDVIGEQLSSAQKALESSGVMEGSSEFSRKMVSEITKTIGSLTVQLTQVEDAAIRSVISRQINLLRKQRTGILTEMVEKTAEQSSAIFDALSGFINKDSRLSIDRLTQLGGNWIHNAVGRMDNNAMWHSMNLLSRLGGVGRSMPHMVNVMDMPNRQRTAQLRDRAQQSMSAQMDAMIMSQKYAQANVGKTVTDIYSFMKQNNIITVRNK